jgi:hypothetical protein
MVGKEQVIREENTCEWKVSQLKEAKMAPTADYSHKSLKICKEI